jgi:hypothetical protein
MNPFPHSAVLVKFTYFVVYSLFMLSKVIGVDFLGPKQGRMTIVSFGPPYLEDLLPWEGFYKRMER